MHRRMRASVLAAIMSACAACAGGCATSVLGESGGLGEYAYGGGELYLQVGDSLDRTLNATIAAMEQSQVIVRETTRGDGWARVTGEQHGGRDVKVRLKSQGGLTEIFVRVGFWGNEPHSRAITDRIRAALATSP